MWDEPTIRRILQEVAHGNQSVDSAWARLRGLPMQNLDFARLDHHRELRQGFSEVVYCAGKTPQQAAQILHKLSERHDRVLGTRATPEHFDQAHNLVPDLQYHEQARAIWLDRSKRPRKTGVVVMAAGTADLPVAEEAALTLEVMGHAAQRVYDVGVAGLHRLLGELPIMQTANVIVAVAGMEGALPSVIGGLVSCPVVAVPTSVGYGTGINGLAALLSMLNSCASGLAVVNIDNGFGAGCVAARINALAKDSVTESDSAG
ncbi:MAG TPA: nickel pincer cofactor biosynthesis protein LarB [Tepidisphaeraceae bacterium]|nr:nickel pincer cofactor biosynthesis protein LarB [Tepidisphaeraceae bacterium]